MFSWLILSNHNRYIGCKKLTWSLSNGTTYCKMWKQVYSLNVFLSTLQNTVDASKINLKIFNIRA